MEPSYASDTNEMAPLGVIPINTFTVFLFLYAEKVQAWDSREEGLSTGNSVASMIIRVLGYSFLNASGIYFFTMCHGGNLSIDLKL